MDEIEKKILEFLNHSVEIVKTDDNNLSGLVLRLRILIQDEDRFGENEGDINHDDDDNELLRTIQKRLLDNVHLRGVAGIKKVYLSKKTMQRWTEDGWKKRDEWLLETDGTNLAEVMTFPQVNHATTVSNDVLEMFRVLGVEGARSSLFNELRNVLSFDGAYVNYRHIACLADCMTFPGYIMAVSRHGINRGDSGPMLRASFEETVEIFMQAAVFSEVDVLNGVTENVMLGQLARLGTGMVDLIVDSKQLIHARSMITEAEVELEEGADQDARSLAKQQGAGGYGDSAQTPFMTPFGSATPSDFGGFGATTPAAGSFTPTSGSYRCASFPPILCHPRLHASRRMLTPLRPIYARHAVLPSAGRALRPRTPPATRLATGPCLHGPPPPVVGTTRAATARRRLLTAQRRQRTARQVLLTARRARRTARQARRIARRRQRTARQVLLTARRRQRTARQVLLTARRARRIARQARRTAQRRQRTARQVLLTARRRRRIARRVPLIALLRQRIARQARRTALLRRTTRPTRPAATAWPPPAPARRLWTARRLPLMCTRHPTRPSTRSGADSA